MLFIHKVLNPHIIWNYTMDYTAMDLLSRALYFIYLNLYSTRSLYGSSPDKVLLTMLPESDMSTLLQFKQHVSNVKCTNLIHDSRNNRHQKDKRDFNEWVTAIAMMLMYKVERDQLCSHVQVRELLYTLFKINMN
jgi:hypothetical protein